MQIFKVSQSVAVRRYFYFHLVDVDDGITPEVGEAGGQPQISKNGGGFINTTNTLIAIGTGAYYVELTTTELNTLGTILCRYSSVNTAEFQDIGYVLAVDLFDADTMGITYLTSIKAKTDSLPADPASETTVLAIPADVDTELSGTHGAGSWESPVIPPFPPVPTPAEIDAQLSASHGNGNWVTGKVFKV